MKAVVFTLGCKVNRYESDYIAQELAQKGYEVSDELSFADVYVLNTCAVTAEAEKKSRQAIARCRKFNEKARIFVIGCASQKNAGAFMKDNVVYVAGTGAKYDVINRIDQTAVTVNNTDLPTEFETGTLYTPSRTRSFIKIQDGCNNFCSYCVIPYLRGRSRSASIPDIVHEAELLSEKTPEIVLTGINTMAFGKERGESLTDLIRALKNIDVRIRLSSFYAEGITEELMDALYSLKKFCPHYHLSLQSGDEKVLKDMNRRYTPEIYRKKIELVRSYDQNASVTTDVIVGYPTEGEENFLNTLRFCRKEAFSDLHIFPYSPREGTAAYRLKKLPSDVVADREKRLFDLKKELRTNYLKNNIGKEQEVLIEEKQGDYFVGYSRNYVKIYLKNDGNIVNVTPTEIYSDGLK